MVSEEIFAQCLPILEDKDLDEEGQVEKLQELLQEKASLSGQALENAVLDVLWRHRNSTNPDSSPPPARHTVIRRSSPAPWQMGRSSTPLSSPGNTGTSPAGPSWLPASRGSFPRGPRSSTAASPFTSPRPSPRLALAQPIPHSPSLNAYEFSDQSQVSDFYGDLGSESNVDWLVGDDANSTTSSVGGHSAHGGLSATAPEFIPDMSPYDILRSVLGEHKTNEEIEAALEANSYDLGATLASFAREQETDGTQKQPEEGKILVGKSMTMDQAPSGQGRSPVVCKYFLSTGQCLRADCRFSHDLSSHVCKYWLMGNCLAGDGCPFSHDPSSLIGNLNISGGNNKGSTTDTQQQALPVENYEAFPALQPAAGAGEQWANTYLKKYPSHMPGLVPQGTQLGGARRNGHSRPHSRPTSRHREANPAPSVDDPDAFPSLAAVSARNSGKKHHGKRGGQNHSRESNLSKENTPSSLADVVRNAPSPAPGKSKASSKNSKEAAKSARDSAAVQAIPTPKHIPWLETGPRANQQYIKYRTDALRHGTVRNKFLQSAAQAWNRNDARAAKALSLRGQAENEAMRKCHREAARHLYEERHKHLEANGLNDATEELYVDLHGLHPEEAVEYLKKILIKHAKDRRVLYAITGTGHHSKNGKDKVGKAVKVFLNEWKYIFREFSVPGEKGGYVGGILGIDPGSYDKTIAKAEGLDDGDDDAKAETEAEADGEGNQPPLTNGKIQLLKREEAALNKQ